MSVDFNFNWEIEWAEFEEIPTKTLVKKFIFSIKNLVFHWRAEISANAIGNDRDKFCFSLYYEDGPTSDLYVVCLIKIVKPDKSYQLVQSSKFLPWALSLPEHKSKPYQYDRIDRGSGRHWPNFDEIEIGAFRKKYGLSSELPISYRVDLSVVVSAINFSYPSSTKCLSCRFWPSWIGDAFEFIENKKKSEDSDIRLISNDYHSFYCHKIIIRGRSESLAALFRNPKTDEEKSGVFRFRTLNRMCLKAVLKFFYTNKLPECISSLDLMKLVDFGQQYQITNLKESCFAYLWLKVMKSSKTMEILRFADLHGDKYLKDRAMLTLANYDEQKRMRIKDFLPSNKEGNERERKQGKRLLNEFILFNLRRLGV